MHEKFFEIARSNMVKNQIFQITLKKIIDALLEIKKNFLFLKRYGSCLQ